MKKKTYVLMISKEFPAYHSCKGQPTHFEEKIKRGVKIHTIRQNYALWKKREEKINAGQAVLSLRKWSGKPRRSKQVEIMQLEKIGVQSIIISETKSIFIDGDKKIFLPFPSIAFNDGLLYNEFMEWFNGSTNELNAIVHFTDFRYS
jgi:hypothetical protein